MKSHTLFHKRISGIIPFVVLFLAIVTLASTSAEAQDPFITTWQVTAGDLDITIPTFPGETYNYDVDWGDGNSDSGITGDATHTYAGAGTYTVEITGDFPRIYFWNDGAPSDAEKILSVEQWGDIAWSSMELAFRGASNLEINATDAPDLSGVTTTRQMFFGATSMNSDLNHWDVSSVTSMRSMFQQASSFNQPLGSWDVSNVTNMSQIFGDASAFNQDIGGWDVSNVIDMGGMFAGSSFNQDISTKTINAGTSDEYVAWDVSNVRWMSSLFHRTPFNQDISGWDVSNVEDMYGMFNGTTAFNQDISGWDVSNVTDMEFMFRETSAFNQDIGIWDVGNVTNMRGMFYRAGVFNQDISGWIVSNVTDMEFMFFNASPFDQDIGSWDMGNVTIMDSMLSGSGLSTVNYDNTLTGWAGQTVQSGVTLGADGLEYCAETARQTLTDPPNNWTITGDALASGCSSTNAFITTWEVTAGDLDITIPTFPGETYNYNVDWGNGSASSGVTGDAANTYSSAGTYTVEITGDFPRIYFNNTGDKDKIMTVEQWGDIAWTSMENAFSGAANLEINASDAPDLSGVTSMVLMFREASSMNSDLNHWDVSNVTDMDALFFGATVFNGNITGWDVSNVTSTSSMFQGAISFNQDISGWDVGNISNMSSMFDIATSFNQDIGGWDVSGATDMSHMFRDGTFNQDISLWDVSNVTNMTTMFQNNSSFNQNVGGWDIGNVTDMGGMLDNSGLSIENYDNVLTGWAGQTVQSGVSLGAINLEYCNAGDERQILIDAPNNWTINGDGLAAGCPVQQPFITTWKTDNPGISANTQILIPTHGGETYNYDVYWEDVTDASDNGTINGNTGDLTITFPDGAGTYRVEITGDFPRIFFDNGGDANKILTIEQWGDIEWSSMANAFKGTSNLEINSTTPDAPDLSGAVSTVQMFWGASSLNSDLNHWDVSTITNMTFMFGFASAFDGDISSWDVSSADRMFSMFAGASSFNQDISGWNVANVTNMAGMFSGASLFNQDLSGWDVSGVTDMNGMFRNASLFNQDISSWDVSNVTNMQSMFDGASSFNQDLGGWDVSMVTGMRDMLNGSGLSNANYDNTLIGWAGLPSLQSGVPLGAAGLEYCNSETERQSLIDAPNNWTITGDALAAGCGIPIGTDQRILASNQSTFIFSGGNFGIADAAYSVKIETLPGNGDLQFDGTPVSAMDVISVTDINDDKLTWDAGSNDHGYDYTSFDFRVVDGGGGESDPPNTLSIDLGAASVELTGGEGWRFLTSPAIGETFGGFLNPVWTQGVTGSNDPGASFPNVYRIDQPSYTWDVPGNMSDPIGIGEAFITFIYSDDNSDGTPDGFPKMLMSGESWNPLDGTFEFTGLDYDTGQGPEGDSHFLIANPHPISLDFCKMYDVSTNIASSVDIWDPAANGGNGDYINLNCTAESVHLAPFQGFWVRTTDINPDLDIPEDAYLGSQATGYFKENSPLSRGGRGVSDEPSVVQETPFLLTLNLSDDESAFTNTARILFSEEASVDLDEFDAPKLSPAGLANRWLSFYSLDEESNAYAFQSLPADIEEKVSIPLDIQTTEAGRFTLDWSLPEATVFNSSYFLRDNRTGEVIELREGASYSFEVTQKQAIQTKQTGDTHPMSVQAMNEILQSPTHRMSSGAEPRFELLIAASGVDGFTELGAVPEAFELAQNYPNPFNPTTVISYQLPVNSEVRLEVYDMLGRRVAQLINGQVAAGRHTVNFDAGGLSSGVYLYRLAAGSTIMTKKLTVVK